MTTSRHELSIDYIVRFVCSFPRTKPNSQIEATTGKGSHAKRVLEERSHSWRIPFTAPMTQLGLNLGLFPGVVTQVRTNDFERLCRLVSSCFLLLSFPRFFSKKSVESKTGRHARASPPLAASSYSNGSTTVPRSLTTHSSAMPRRSHDL